MLFDLNIFVSAVFSRAMAEGALLSIGLSLAVAACAFVAALPFAAGLNASRRAVRWPLLTYIWLFRGAPMLLVLLFVWNGLPQMSPVFRATWFSPFVAAFVALTLVTIAYFAEILRASYLAVTSGQREAARALGLQPVFIFALIVLPQAIRVAIPSLMNEFISLLKTTSLAYTISLRELMTVTSLQVSASFRFTEWYAAALTYYLVVVSVLMVVQGWFEARGSSQSRAPR